MAEAALMKISWASLAGIVLAAGASGAAAATATGVLSSTDNREIASAGTRTESIGDAEQRDADEGSTSASPEEIARALVLLQAHLANQASNHSEPTEQTASSPGAPAATDPETWDDGQGESAATALARLERAYLEELQRNAALEEERNAQLERSDALMRDTELARRAELDRSYELEVERSLARQDRENAVHAAAIQTATESEHELGEPEASPPASVNQYAMVSSIYAPVFVGAAPAAPLAAAASHATTPSHSTAYPYPIIPPGAFLGVHIPQSSSSNAASNQTQVSVSYRPRPPSNSPWAPINMGQHNNPWASTPGFP